MSSIYVYSLYHLLFILGIFFVWRLFDKKLDYKNYLKITLVVGVINTIFYDFVCGILFGFWGYYSTNVMEYVLISFSTYIIATPFFVEVIDFVLYLTTKVDLGYRLKLKKITAVLVLLIIIILGGAIAFLKLSGKIEASWAFFATCFVVFIIAIDMLLYVRGGVKGVLVRFLNGQILAPFALILSGWICGFLWEIFNTYMPMWYYKNLPPQEIFGVPLVVIMCWGILVYAYWASSQLLFKKYRLRTH